MYCFFVLVSLKSFSKTELLFCVENDTVAMMACLKACAQIHSEKLAIIEDQISLKKRFIQLSFEHGRRNRRLMI